MTDLADSRTLPPRRRPPRRRLPKAVGVLVVLLVLVGLLAGAALGARALLSSFGGSSTSADYAGAGAGEVLVQVGEGDSASDIALELREKDVVASAGAFRTAAAQDTRSRSVQPGFYRLRQQMSAAAALDLLLDPASRARSRVTLPEGVTLADALQRIADTTEVPLKQLAGRGGQAGGPGPARLRRGPGRGLPVPGDLRRRARHDRGAGAAR